MFLNNPASTRSILTNNENAATGFHRSKSMNENGTTKKTTFNENSTKTPGTSKAKGGGQTTQRRRRALGDISNRKAGGGKGGSSGGGKGGGGVILKQGSSSLKSANSNTTTKSNRTSQVKFSKTPSTKSSSSNKARLGGGGSGLKSANSKPKQRASTSEYDGVFGVTTRWAHEDVEEDTRSPLDLIPKEEMNMLDDFEKEVHTRMKKEYDERERLEMERYDKRIEEMLNDIDIDDLEETSDAAVEKKEQQHTDEWDLLDEKLPWEEEDGDFDPAEERRLSGSDPYSLWGDII